MVQVRRRDCERFLLKIGVVSYSFVIPFFPRIRPWAVGVKKPGFLFVGFRETLAGFGSMTGVLCRITIPCFGPPFLSKRRKNCEEV
jgi:hypothetical protein